MFFLFDRRGSGASRRVSAPVCVIAALPAQLPVAGVTLQAGRRRRHRSAAAAIATAAARLLHPGRYPPSGFPIFVCQLFVPRGTGYFTFRAVFFQFNNGNTQLVFFYRARYFMAFSLNVNDFAILIAVRALCCQVLEYELLFGNVLNTFFMVPSSLFFKIE